MQRIFLALSLDQFSRSPFGVEETPMRIMESLKKHLLLSLLVVLVFAAELPATGRAQEQSQTSSPAPSSGNTSPASKPDSSPSAGSPTLPDTPAAAIPSTAGGQQPADMTPGSPVTSPSQAGRPVGTAAAEPLATKGVTGSKPAGIALAPRKQPRARSILIKVGVIVAVAAAVGTTVALTSASPSTPPGSH